MELRISMISSLPKRATSQPMPVVGRSYVPKVAFRIAAAESVAAVVLIVDIDHDFESGGLGSGLNYIGVCNNQVWSLGFFAVDIHRLEDIPAIFVIHN
jgi:hypothetical protein